MRLIDFALALLSQLGAVIPGRRSLNYFKFEGGLGSQLLCAMELEILRVFGNPHYIRINLTYFEKPAVDRNSQGLSFWSWELDRYGITQMNLKSKYLTYAGKYFRPKFNEYNFLKTNVYRNHLRLNANQLFPIDSINLQKNLLDLGVNDDFSFMHIRRGDYVNIGAHQTALEDYQSLVSQLKPLISGSLLISSDSPIPKNFIEAISSILGDEIFVTTLENYVAAEIHDLMRSARVLIASNSTFSVSAGLLANLDSKVFVPIDYFGTSQSPNRQNPFLGAGKFFLLS